MPANSAFKVTYPSTVTITALTKCQIVYKTVTYTMTSCSLDVGNRVISISGGFTLAVAAGDSVAIVFGPVTNPIT
jgi:hypothetical protein